jgi:glycerol-3-phosphate dehydrogenase
MMPKYLKPYDVCIIGGGVVGLNIAREISRFRLQVCVVEKEADVGRGCSKANSGIVHGGYSDEPGTLKAELCVAGNRLYEQLDRELHFGYRKTGSLVLAFAVEELPVLEKLLDNGRKNGVTGLRIIDRQELLLREPHLNPAALAALLCEDAGVTSPYEFAIALAENSLANGVDLRLQEEVLAIEPLAGEFHLKTSRSELRTRFVVNCAGIFSDRIASLVGLSEYLITPRRGQYVILDKDQSHLAHSVVFQVPTRLGKGILVTPTFHGNLMVGPNAEEIDDKTDVGTDAETLSSIIAQARHSVPGFDTRKALTSFAGNRPVSNQKDWVIDARRRPGFINLIGIDSPGLTASPAIARKVCAMLQQAGLSLEPKPEFQPQRPPIIRKKTTDFVGDLNASDPALHIICRCEQVTEAEILDCLSRGIPVRSLDAVKFRTRAGMGRCQGVFCGPRVRELLSRELAIPRDDICGKGECATLISKRVPHNELIKLE